MQIEQVWLIDGNSFNTKVEAEKYLADNENKGRIYDFAAYKRSQGAQRVNTSIIEEFLLFEAKIACEGPKNTDKHENQVSIEDNLTDPPLQEAVSEIVEVTKEVEVTEEVKECTAGLNEQDNQSNKNSFEDNRPSVPTQKAKDLFV